MQIKQTLVMLLHPCSCKPAMRDHRFTHSCVVHQMSPGGPPLRFTKKQLGLNPSCLLLLFLISIFLKYRSPASNSCLYHHTLNGLYCYIFYLTCLLRTLYAGQEATVRTRQGTTDLFQFRKCVHQGCILSPYLFNLYAEYIM